MTRLKRWFIYLIIINLVSLLLLIAFLKFQKNGQNFKSSLKKLKYKVLKPLITLFEEIDEAKSELKKIKIKNISNREFIKLFKNEILFDLLDLKYDLMNEVYIDDDRNRHLNSINHLIQELDRSKIVSAYYNTDKKLFKEQIVCNEIDNGRLSGYPKYEIGLDFRCNQTNLNKIITIVLNAVEIESKNELTKFLDSLECKSANKVIAVSDRLQLSILDPSIKLIKFNSTKNEAAIWNNLIEKHVNTEFVLVGRDITKILPKYVKLERFVKILDEIPNMQAVSSSYREDNNGHTWSVGCYQWDLNNKKLTFKDYYVQSSSHDSIFCDYLNGPFAARRRVLIENKFDEEKLKKGNEIFVDLFFRFNQIGYLSSVIVDSMFFVSKKLSIEENELNEFAIKWNIEEIQVNDKINYDICERSNGMMCEDYKQMEFIKNIFTSCEAKEVSCYLEISKKKRVINFKRLKFYYYSKKEIKFEQQSENVQFEILNDLFNKVFYKKNFLYHYWFNVSHSN